jgi:paired small multidrug resistance pump
MNKYWLAVLFAGMFEVVWVAGLKYSDSLLEWTATLIAVVASFYVLIKATEYLPIGTVYAVFTGIGTAGAVITEMLLFGEPFNFYKLLLIGTLLIGVIGLKIVTGESSDQQELTEKRGA